MAPFRNVARFMMVKATMTERTFNLVVPLAHKATAMRITDTAGLVARNRSGAVTPPADCDVSASFETKKRTGAVIYFSHERDRGSID